MRIELPTNIYRGLNKVQHEAQETLLLVADTFEALEKLQAPDQVPTLEEELDNFSQMSTALLLQWKRFMTTLETLKEHTHNWGDEARELEDLRFCADLDEIDPIARLTFEDEDQLEVPLK